MTILLKKFEDPNVETLNNLISNSNDNDFIIKYQIFRIKQNKLIIKLDKNILKVHNNMMLRITYYKVSVIF